MCFCFAQTGSRVKKKKYGVVGVCADALESCDLSRDNVGRMLNRTWPSCGNPLSITDHGYSVGHDELMPTWFLR